MIHGTRLPQCGPAEYATRSCDPCSKIDSYLSRPSMMSDTEALAKPDAYRGSEFGGFGNLRRHRLLRSQTDAGRDYGS
jgi:hypothetical protein